jgi:hypothetical protein
MLARALHGSPFTSVDLNDPNSAQALKCSRFRESVPSRVVNRISNISENLIPAEFLKLENYLEDLGLGDIYEIAEAIKKFDIPRGLVVEDALPVVFKILDDLIERLSHQQEIVAGIEPLISKLEGYIINLRPKIREVTLEYQPFLAQVSNIADQEVVAKRNELHLRRILQKHCRLVEWDEINLPKSELRIIFEASNRDLSLTDAVERLLASRGLPTDEYNRLSLIIDNEIGDLDPESFANASRRATSARNKLIKLTDELSRINAQWGINAAPRYGRPYVSPRWYELDRGDDGYILFKSLLSMGGQRKMKSLVRAMEAQAARGKKSLNLGYGLIGRGFSLTSAGSLSVSFEGSINRFLDAINHSDGLGVGYEISPTAEFAGKLNIYWY